MPSESNLPVMPSKQKKKVEPPILSRPIPPHFPPVRTPLSYTRRVEGLLNPKDRLSLEGPYLFQDPSRLLTPLVDVIPSSPHRPIANLVHGLDRVLFKYVIPRHKAFAE